MGKGQKTYLLSLFEQRELKKNGIKRITREVKKRKKNHKIFKEKTVILTARVAESSYARFTSFIGYEPNTEGAQPLGPAVEDALLLAIAYEGLDCKTLLLHYSDLAFERNRALLAEFRKKRRGGPLGAKSKGYSYQKVRALTSGYQVTVSIPRMRGSFKSKLEKLMKYISSADIDVVFFREDILHKPRAPYPTRDISKVKFRPVRD